MASHRNPILCVAALLACTSLAQRASAQSTIASTPQRNGGIQTPSAGPGAPSDPHDHVMSTEISTRMAAARNDERQKRLVSDTEKLLALATSLKTDVGKTDKNILSLDVIRRSEEIEKLAKSIRERAKS